MEMPDRWSDIVNQEHAGARRSTTRRRSSHAVPALSRNYYRRLLEAAEQRRRRRWTSLDNQGAECLYMIVMFGTGDGEARTMFTSQDIGDTDGDGAPEFLDGWGNPIHCIRWPAGFVPRVGRSMTGDGDGDHDPFDVFRRDSPASSPSRQPAAEQSYPPEPFSDRRPSRCGIATTRSDSTQRTPQLYLAAFRLVPLIYSGGRDERIGFACRQGRRSTTDRRWIRRSRRRSVRPTARRDLRPAARSRRATAGKTTFTTT